MKAAGKYISRTGTFLCLLVIATTVFANIVISDARRIGPINPDRMEIFIYAGWIFTLLSLLLLFRKGNFRFSPADRWMLAGFIYLLGHFYFTASIAFVRLEISTVFFASYFLLRGLSSTFSSFRNTFVFLLLLTGITEALWGLGQVYGFFPSYHPLYKLTGSLFNPGPYSGLLATLLPLALWETVQTGSTLSGRSFLTGIPDQILKITGSICLALICIILPAGMSRSAWIGALAGCGMVCIHRYRLTAQLRRFYTAHKRRFLVYGGILLFCSLLGGTGIYHLKKDSADGRMLMWKISAQTISRHPITGSGNGRFGGCYGEAQAAYFAQGNGSEQEKRVAGAPEYGFNEYLQITIEYGLTGLLIFCGLLLSALHRAIKSGNIGMAGSLTALLVFAFFSYPFNLIPLCTILTVLLVLCQTTQPDIRKTSIQTTLYRYCYFPLFGLLLAGSSGLLYRQLPAFQKWREEKSFFSMNIFKGTVENYAHLYPQLQEFGAFLFEYGQCLSKTGQYEAGNRILTEGTRLSSDPMFYNIIGKNNQALGKYKQAEKAFQQAYYRVPNRLYPLYLLARLYAENGQTEKALETIQAFLQQPPKVVSSATKEMTQELQKLERQLQERP